MRQQIMQMISENPRTVKEMAEATGLSKQEVMKHLAGLPVRSVRTVNYRGKSSPFFSIHYAMK
jgi:predicted transcriptional regulator